MEGKKRVIPGEDCTSAPKRVSAVQGNEAVLIVQKSAEAIVAER